MDAQEKLFELIEAYIGGALDPAQKLQFETQLSSDEALQKEVARHRKAALAIQYGYHMALKEQLRAIDKQIQPAKTRRLVSFRPGRLAAAASVLIILAVGAHFYAHRTYSTSAVAEKLFAPAQTDVFRGREEYVISLGERFAEAERLFHEGRYDEARQQYLVIIKEDSLLKDQAEWNLALCYYAIHPSSGQFQILFDRLLMDTGHDYHQRAKELLEIMDGTLYKMVN